MKVGIELEFSSLTSYDNSDYWSKGTDSSIVPEDDISETGEYRLRHPVPFSHIKPHMKEMAKAISDNSFKVNVSCGTHVHTDMRGTTIAQRKRIVRAWSYLEPFFFKLVPKYRLKSSYCESVESCTHKLPCTHLHDESCSRIECQHVCTTDCIRELFFLNCVEEHRHLEVCYNTISARCSHNCIDDNCYILDCKHIHNEDCKPKAEDCRYHSLNTLAYYKYMSFEYRLGPGSANMEYVYNWTLLLVRFTRWAMNSSRDKINLIGKLMSEKRIPFSYFLHFFCHTKEEIGYWAYKVYQYDRVFFRKQFKENGDTSLVLDRR